MTPLSGAKNARIGVVVLLCRGLKILLAAVIGGLIILYFFQDKLLFFPQAIPESKLVQIRTMGNKVEPINLQMKDGTAVRGWFVKNSERDKAKVIIVYGGNAEELSYLIDISRKMGNWSVVLMNYRGYGQSEGTPSEKNLCSDALEIYDYFSHREDVDNSKIVVMGRSLGTGVATYVASHRNPIAAILISPYDSIANIAKEVHPNLPVDLMLKHRFDSISLAASIQIPLHVLIATDDILIKPWHSRALVERWGGKVDVQEIQGANHDAIIGRTECWESIIQFLKSLED